MHWLAPLEPEDVEEAGADAWLEALGVDYDPHLVRIYRLHILKRFHDYAVAEPPAAAADAADHARALLQRAHDDFVGSDARSQGALRVHRLAAEQAAAEVPLSSISRRSAW